MNNVQPLFPHYHQIGDLVTLNSDFDNNLDAPTHGVVVMRVGPRLTVLLAGGLRITCTEHELHQS